jgi:hypothetical protein
VFQDLIRHRRVPGPKNLLALVEDFLKTHGSAKRDAIVRHLRDTWMDSGGLPLSGQPWESREEHVKWASRVKRVLATLRQQGRVREVVDSNGVRMHGTWEWVVVGQTPARRTAAGEADLNVGDGEYLLYGVYDPRLRQQAIDAGHDRWLMKIGKTRSRSPYDRIQDGAFLPDRLVWGIAVWTDDPDTDERLVRSILERKGLRYEGTGGKEWFTTNPLEVQTIYASLLPP